MSTVDNGNRMQLGEYLKKENIRPGEFAVRVGVKERAVYRWLERERIPRPSQIQRIAEITRGKVGPSDFILTGAAK